jgi:hypothetical protein
MRNTSSTVIDRSLSALHGSGLRGNGRDFASSSTSTKAQLFQRGAATPMPIPTCLVWLPMSCIKPCGKPTTWISSRGRGVIGSSGTPLQFCWLSFASIRRIPKSTKRVGCSRSQFEKKESVFHEQALWA